jgi:hypothetical protein
MWWCNDQEPNYEQEVIDITPMQWVIQWHYTVRDENSKYPMHYHNLLLNQMEITEEEYKAFKEKYD